MKKFTFLTIFCLFFFLSVSYADDTAQKAPYSLSFKEALRIDDINDIAYGNIIYNRNKVADIAFDDLYEWLNVHWNFTYDRVIAPPPVISGDEYYIKLWNKDKSKSYTIYASSGVIAGMFGSEYEKEGIVYKNCVWYKPYIGNAKNALYNANEKIYHKYIDNTRDFTEDDINTIPQNNNLLNIENCSSWAKDGISKAAAMNIMMYDLSDKYTSPISRLDFCILSCRLISTIYSPNSDSRTGIYSVNEQIIYNKGLDEKYNDVSFDDCDEYYVKFLAATDIINGIGDGKFAPDEHITREQAAAILYRIAKFLGTDIRDFSDVIYYSDFDKISGWAASSVKAISDMNIMHGTGNGNFSPLDSYTAEQAIITMLRLYEYK